MIVEISTPQDVFSWAESFTNLERGTYPPDKRVYRLDRMRRLLEMFDNPEARLRIIHVAGTKGKGSTSALLASVLCARWWFDISFAIYLQHVFEILRHPILTTSYIRSALMGFFIAVNACGLGFYFNGGAVELGRTTTKSIVLNFIFVISIDCLYGVADQLTGWSAV